MPCCQRCLVGAPRNDRRGNLVASLVQMLNPLLERLIRDRASAGRRDEPIGCALDDVLVDTAVFVQEAQGGFELVDEQTALPVRQPLHVAAVQLVQTPMRPPFVMNAVSSTNPHRAIRRLIAPASR